MRQFVFALLVVAGCTNISGEGAAAQAIAGPGGVTATARAGDELAVSWAQDPAASQYQVYQQAGGGPFAFVATVFGSASPPATSYIDSGLTSGVQYCYSIEATYPDGTTSGMGAAG